MTSETCHFTGPLLQSVAIVAFPSVDQSWPKKPASPKKTLDSYKHETLHIVTWQRPPFHNIMEINNITCINAKFEREVINNLMFMREIGLHMSSSTSYRQNMLTCDVAYSNYKMFKEVQEEIF